MKLFIADIMSLSAKPGSMEFPSRDARQTMTEATAGADLPRTIDGLREFAASLSLEGAPS